MSVRQEYFKNVCLLHKSLQKREVYFNSLRVLLERVIGTVGGAISSIIFQFSWSLIGTAFRLVPRFFRTRLSILLESYWNCMNKNIPIRISPIFQFSWSLIGTCKNISKVRNSAQLSILLESYWNVSS